MANTGRGGGGLWSANSGKKSIKTRIMRILLIIMLVSAALSGHAYTVQQVRDSLVKYEVYEVEISLAIVIYETGLKPDGMLLRKNNLFAFNSPNGYIRFKSWRSAILSYKHYQERRWLPTGRTYLDYLLTSNYAPNMPQYISRLKKIIKTRLG